VIYTGDPRRLLKPTDPPHLFYARHARPPAAVHHDKQERILSIYFEPAQGHQDSLCPLCLGPATRVRLFDVDDYTIQLVGPGQRWELEARTRAAEFSPCPHVIAPYVPGWSTNYIWPPNFGREWPLPPNLWARPVIAITEQEQPA
jgi:hypothetical protein